MMTVKSDRVLKVCSMLLINCMLFTSLGWAIDPSISFQSKFALDLHLNIPKSAGNIINHHRGNKKTVFLIEDLHCHYEVQKNIAQIVEHLIKSKNISLIGQEGSSTAVDVAVLRDFPLQSVRLAVGDYFLKQGKITGTEFLAATSKHKINLLGIENETLYEQSLKSARGFLNAESQGIIYDIKDQLTLLKKQHYTAGLKAYDNNYQSFYNGKTSFLNFVFYLEKLDSSLNINIDLTELLSKYWKTPGSINHYPVNDQLVDEMHRLDKQIRDKLYTTNKQRLLDQYLEYTEIVLKLVNVSATPADLEFYQYYKGLYRSSTFIQFLRQHRLNNLEGLQGDLGILEEYCQQAERFYQLADQRSAVFVKNLIKKMDKQHQQTAIMISGGFHTAKIQASLADHNVSYVVIKPNMTKADLNNPYFELLTNKQSPIEKLLTQQPAMIALPSAWNKPTHKQLVILLNKMFGLKNKVTSKRLQKEINKYWKKYQDVDVVMMNVKEFQSKQDMLTTGDWFSVTIGDKEIIVVMFLKADLPKAIDDDPLFTSRSEFIDNHSIIFYQSPGLALEGVKIIAEHRIWDIERIDRTLKNVKNMFRETNKKLKKLSKPTSAVGERIDPELLISQCAKNVYCRIMSDEDIKQVKNRLKALAQVEVSTGDSSTRQTFLDYLVEHAYNSFPVKSYLDPHDKYSVLKYCEILVRGSYLYAPNPNDIDCVILYKQNTFSAEYLAIPEDVKLYYPPKAWRQLGKIPNLTLDIMTIGQESKVWTDYLQRQKMAGTAINLVKRDWTTAKITELDQLVLMDWSLGLAKMLLYRHNYRKAIQRLLEGYAFYGLTTEDVKVHTEQLYKILRDDFVITSKQEVAKQIAILEGFFLQKLEKYFEEYPDSYKAFYNQYDMEMFGLLISADYEYQAGQFEMMLFHLCEFYGALGQMKAEPEHFIHAADLYGIFQGLDSVKHMGIDPMKEYLIGQLRLAQKKYAELAWEIDATFKIKETHKIVYNLPFRSLDDFDRFRITGGIFPWLKVWYVNWKLTKNLNQEKSLDSDQLQIMKKQLTHKYALNAWWIEGLVLTGFAMINSWFMTLIDPTLSLQAIALYGLQSAWILFPLAHLLPEPGSDSLSEVEKKNVSWAMFLATINLAFSMTAVPIWAMIGFGFISHWLMNKMIRVFKDQRKSPEQLISLKQVLNQGELNHIVARQYVLGPLVEQHNQLRMRKIISTLGDIRCRLGWRFSLTNEQVAIKDHLSSTPDYSSEKRIQVLTLPWYAERLLVLTPEKKWLHKWIYQLMAAYVTRKIEAKLEDALELQTKAAQYKRQPPSVKHGPQASDQSVLNKGNFENQIGRYLSQVDCIKPFLAPDQAIAVSYQQWRDDPSIANKKKLIAAIATMLTNLVDQFNNHTLTQQELDQALDAINNLYTNTTLIKKYIIGFRGSIAIWAPKSADLKTLLTYIRLCQYHQLKTYLVYDLVKKIIRSNRAIRRIYSDA